MTAVDDPELALDEVFHNEEDGDEMDAAPAVRTRRRLSAPAWAMLVSLVAVLVLAALLGWFGIRAHQAQQAQAQRSQFLQVARQGALNLTTIDWQHADVDVRRILDGATGEFYNDFAKRSEPFVEVLRQAKATTVGTITEAGLESEAADTAQVLVTVAVRTSNAGESEPVPRAWRMRITVQKVGEQIKVSNVGFVP